MEHWQSQGLAKLLESKVSGNDIAPWWFFMFFLCVYAFMCYAQCATILGTFHNVYKILACKPTRTASRLLKSEAGDGHFAWARGERRHPGRRSPASPEVIRRNGGLVLSRTHPGFDVARLACLARAVVIMTARGFSSTLLLRIQTFFSECNRRNYITKTINVIFIFYKQ